MALLGGILFIIIGELNERGSSWCRSALQGSGAGIAGGGTGTLGGGKHYGGENSRSGNAHQGGGTAAGKIGIPLIVQGIIAACIITAGELAAGLVLNVWLGLEIWDYSDLPFNFLGQICLKFSLLWIAAGMIAVVLDDYLRYLLFGEEKPKYRII